MQTRLRRHCGMLIAACAMMAACGNPEPEAPSPPTPVSTLTLTPAPMELHEDLPGRIAAVRIAEIRPQVGGIVQRRLFEQGTEVRAGQPLFQIDAAPFRADVAMAAAALQRAEAARSHAQIQTDRLKSLLDADAISRQTFDDAASVRDQAAAEAAQARATLERRKLDLAFATIEAPISGRIDQAMVTEGALVGSGDTGPMALIQQIDQVYVDVRRPASSLQSLRQALAQVPGKGNGLPVNLLRSDGSSYDIHGHILFSGINVDAGTGDVLLRVLVDNPDRALLPGMFVRTRVPKAIYADALSVPQQAVLRIGGKPSVWVLDANNQSHLTAVELGELIYRRYRVIAGVHAGQKVVVEGIERLTEGAAVSATEWRGARSAADVTIR